MESIILKFDYPSNSWIKSCNRMGKKLELWEEPCDGMRFKILMFLKKNNNASHTSRQCCYPLFPLFKFKKKSVLRFSYSIIPHDWPYSFQVLSFRFFLFSLVIFTTLETSQSHLLFRNLSLKLLVFCFL